MRDVFHAIADTTRRSILEQLGAEGSLSIAEIAEPLPMSRQATTKHLDILVRSGLVTIERRGRERRHSLAADPLQEVAHWLQPFAAAWDRRLTRLESYLDDTSVS